MTPPQHPAVFRSARAWRTVILLLAAWISGCGVGAAQSAAKPEPPSPPTFVSLFTHLGQDFRRLPSRETAILLGVAGAAALAVKGEDADIARRASGSQPLETFLDQGALLGHGVVQVGGAMAAYGAGRMIHSTRTAAVGADLVRAQIVNALLTQTIKVSVNRDRPDGGHYSFPSGHSSGTFATSTVLARHFGWRIGLPAYAVATYVGASRVTENRHFASDVIFGAAVGIVSGRATTVGAGRATFTVSGIPLRGGGAVQLTLLVRRLPVASVIETKRLAPACAGCVVLDRLAYLSPCDPDRVVTVRGILEVASISALR